MGQTFDDLSGRNAEFIAEQRLRFVATAPPSAGGLLDLLPKRLESFDILNENMVAYLDSTGSGTEANAHLREDGLDGLPALRRD